MQRIMIYFAHREMPTGKNLPTSLGHFLLAEGQKLTENRHLLILRKHISSVNSASRMSPAFTGQVGGE